MPLCPIISGTGLSENKIIRAKRGSIRTSPDCVHRSGFEIQKDRPRDIFATCNLKSNALVNHTFSAFTFAFMPEICVRVHVRVHHEILRSRSRSRSRFLNSCVHVHARVHQNITDHESNHKSQAMARF